MPAAGSRRPLFLCSPLDDPAVWDRLSPAAPPAAAWLDGVELAEGPDPALPSTRHVADGRLAGRVAGIGPEAQALANFLGRVLGFRRSEERLIGTGATQGALCLLPPEAADGAEPLDPTAFQAKWQAIWSIAMQEIVDYHGTRDAEWVRAKLNLILSRAHSAFSARQSPQPVPSGLDRKDVTVFRKTRPYSQFFAVEEYELAHRRFDGSDSKRVERAVFVATDAVTVLPYDPVRDRVLVVEQFRAGPFGRGDERPWIFEPVAGRIEPGHTPEQTARKECLEEANLKLGRLVKVAEFYPSTGCVTEYVYSYVGLADLPDGAAGLHGAEVENEDIRGHLMGREEFFSRILAGDMPDAPLILTAYWLQANLMSLREVG